MDALAARIRAEGQDRLALWWASRTEAKDAGQRRSASMLRTQRGPEGPLICIEGKFFDLAANLGCRTGWAMKIMRTVRPTGGFTWSLDRIKLGRFQFSLTAYKHTYATAPDRWVVQPCLIRDRKSRSSFVKG